MPLRKVLPDRLQLSSSLPPPSNPNRTLLQISAPYGFSHVDGHGHYRASSLGPQFLVLEKEGRHLSSPQSGPDLTAESLGFDSLATRRKISELLHPHRRRHSGSSSIYLTSTGALAAPRRTASAAYSNVANEHLSMAKLAISQLLTPGQRPGKSGYDKMPGKIRLADDDHGSRGSERESTPHKLTKIRAAERNNFNSHLKLRSLLGDGFIPRRPSPIEATFAAPARYSGQDAHPTHNEMKLTSSPQRPGPSPGVRVPDLVAKTAKHPHPLESHYNNYLPSIPDVEEVDEQVETPKRAQATKLEHILKDSRPNVAMTPRFRMERAPDPGGLSRLSLAPKLVQAPHTKLMEQEKDSTADEVTEDTGKGRSSSETDGTTESSIKAPSPSLSLRARFLKPAPEMPPSPSAMVLKQKKTRESLRRAMSVSADCTRSPDKVGSEREFPAEPASISLPLSDDSQSGDSYSARLVRAKRSRSFDLRGEFKQRNFSLPSMVPVSHGLIESGHNIPQQIRRPVFESNATEAGGQENCAVCQTVELLGPTEEQPEMP